MTENQERAHEELSRYQDAKREIRHLKQQIEKHEAKVHKSTRSCDSIMRETWRDGKFIAVPVVVRVSCGGNAIEELMDVLMDQRAHYIAAQAEAERVCMDIEVKISRRCSGIHAITLRKFYVNNQRLERIAVDEGYSYPHVKRIRRDALETYGAKIGSENGDIER